MAKKRYPTPQQWYPTNPSKYVGDINKIILRSSWELKFIKWCDVTPAVLKYQSEETVVPYISPVDGRQHRYFIDFTVLLQNKDGSTSKMLIEIKPYGQTIPPKRGKRKTDKYIQELATYAVNQAKWESATAIAKRNGFSFKVLTENELY